MDNLAAKISVIIPVYKTEKYVEDTVLSVLNQSYKNIEVILVDDGSPDGAPQICDRLSDTYENVRVIHKGNGGLSSARNTGILNISEDSKFVFFLDSDDTILPDSLSGMIQQAEKNFADVVMSNKYISVDEDNLSQEKECLLFPEALCYSDAREFVLHTIMENCRGWRATGILYSANIIREHQCTFPMGRISEDVVFNLQFYAKVNKIAYYPSATIKVLKRAGSITHTFQNGFEETIYYIDKQSRAFLKETGLDVEQHQAFLNAMLCRNLVVYLFSIMSSKNSMSKAQKKEYARKVIADSRNRFVFKQKHAIPWFESKKTRLAIKVVYTLLRFKLEGLALLFLSFVG